jgi:WD40 repeat protein
MLRLTVHLICAGFSLLFSFALCQAQADDVVMTLTFSRDYRLLASGGYGDLTVKFWDMKTGQEARTFNTPPTTNRQD